MLKLPIVETQWDEPLDSIPTCIHEEKNIILQYLDTNGMSNKKILTEVGNTR